MRVDYNVPLDSDGKITDDTRIKATLPSIELALKENATLILLSHMGRPKGVEPALSLASCAQRLEELLGHSVLFLPNSIDEHGVSQETQSIINCYHAQHTAAPKIILLENLRYCSAEEKPEKNPQFVKDLAKLGDLYVNDAFATAHRAHTSTTLLAYEFPEVAAAGILLEKEILFLGNSLTKPHRPFCAIIGGAKISSKLGVIKALIEKVDVLLIGGAMAYTFLKAKEIPIGNSLYEPDLVETAHQIIEECLAKKVKLILPYDLQVADRFSNDATTRTVHLYDSGIPDGFEGMDIGPETIRIYSNLLINMETIFWNGPLGVAEFPRFAQGTIAIARALASSPGTTIIGGGDSVAAIQSSGTASQISHISTGGGASLEFIQDGTLPGIEALTDKPIVDTLNSMDDHYHGALNNTH
jgi:phosphoglycerate kinase